MDNNTFIPGTKLRVRNPLLKQHDNGRVTLVPEMLHYEGQFLTIRDSRQALNHIRIWVDENEYTWCDGMFDITCQPINPFVLDIK